MNFEVELRLLIAELLPGFTDFPGLLLVRFLRRTSHYNGARLQGSRSAENAIPEIVCGHDSKADRLATLLSHGQRLGEELLLDAAKQLVGLEFIFTRSRTAQEPDVEHDKVPTPGLDTIEHIAQMVQSVNIADGNKDVARTGADGLGGEFPLQFEVELVHLDMGSASPFGTALRDGKDNVQEDRKCTTRHGCDWLGEQVYDSDQEQCECDQSQPDRNLHAAECNVEWDLEIPVAGTRVPENEHRQSIHREAPDHAESVEVRQESDVATADDDGDNLQRHDDIDDAIARSETSMGLTEPFAEYAVLGYPVQHTVRADNGRIHRTGQDKRAHNNNKAMENQACDEWSL